MARNNHDEREDTSKRKHEKETITMTRDNNDKKRRTSRISEESRFTLRSSTFWYTCDCTIVGCCVCLIPLCRVQPSHHVNGVAVIVSVLAVIVVLIVVVVIIIVVLIVVVVVVVVAAAVVLGWQWPRITISKQRRYLQQPTISMNGANEMNGQGEGEEETRQTRDHRCSPCVSAHRLCHLLSSFIVVSLSFFLL